MEWLERDLKGREERCVLAYWHYPMFSSGFHGDDPRMKTVWEIQSISMEPSCVEVAHFCQILPGVEGEDPAPKSIRRGPYSEAD